MYVSAEGGIRTHTTNPCLWGAGGTLNLSCPTYSAWPFPFYRVKGNLTGNLFYSQELLILADLEGRYLTLTYYSLAMPRKTHIVSI